MLKNIPKSIFCNNLHLIFLIDCLLRDKISIYILRISTARPIITKHLDIVFFTILETKIEKFIVKLNLTDFEINLKTVVFSQRLNKIFGQPKDA